MAANSMADSLDWGNLLDDNEINNDGVEGRQTENNAMGNNQTETGPVPEHNMTVAPQVTEVFDQMRGFLKSTHWSKPYYSSLVHNNPQLPYHLLEHVNCTYLSTPGRAPTLLALKQHAQSLAVLISLLAPAQFGGTLEPPNEGRVNGDAPFAAEQAFDWLNDLKSHYSTEDKAHRKPLNSLVNLVKSNSDTEGPKWYCPLEKVSMEFPENHPFQQCRPYETHMTLLMHANEILERLDHEYSAMGGILAIIPLDSDNVDEQQALTRAKTTLVGQWILYTQQLVVRMHELEIMYGNSLDLLANEAIVPMQHNSIHGPDGRSGREIVFPQDRWILANAGEDVFTFIHQMLDRAEAYQDAQDDVFANQNVLGDAAFSSNEELKYRGIVKADLSTRFYRLRGSGHGPLFVLPAFGDRSSTKHTRDIEKRPTVITIPQPTTKESVSSWESNHQHIDQKMLKLTLEKNNLEAKVAQLNSSVEIREREIERLHQIQKEYDNKIDQGDKDLSKEIVHLRDRAQYFQRLIGDSEQRERVLKQEIENFKQANIRAQDDAKPVTHLVEQINDQQAQIEELRKEIKARDRRIDDVARDNDTLRILSTSSSNRSSPGNPEQVKQLRAQLTSIQKERQMLRQEVHTLKKAKAVRGKILNFPDGFKLDYGSTFEDTNLGITACSSTFYKGLLAAERERDENQQKTDEATQRTHAIQVELDKCKADCERLQRENRELEDKGHTTKPGKVINVPWVMERTSTFRDDNQGLIVLTTGWYDHLVTVEKSAGTHTEKIAELQKKIDHFKAPVSIDLPGSYKEAMEQSGQARSYRDPKLNIAVLALDYFDELHKADQAASGIQQRLGSAHANVRVLEQQLEEARTQLSSGQGGGGEDQVRGLQGQLDEVRGQLGVSLEARRQLEQQVETLARETPASELKAQVIELREELSERARHGKRKEAEIAELQARYEPLRLNESNLRAEVASLRQQLSDVRLSSTGDSGGGGEREKKKKEEVDGGGGELRSVREQLTLYKGELESLQTIWDDLQAQHLVLQTELEDARRADEAEIASLRQALDERTRELDELQQTALAVMEAVE
ncbi:hypothetical protein SAMD00023353_0101930 [Rosellinia necatrix]|uniref:Uncharacterized protein n=1 Tax=Rosellinia necatrix TaxID=77044 RepID=A0A1S7UHL6_ROSNE|nr:hypothetical protein SAMD00023353_0101930 [Rosellinia necatrix]